MVQKLYEKQGDLVIFFYLINCIVWRHVEQVFRQKVLHLRSTSSPWYIEGGLGSWNEGPNCRHPLECFSEKLPAVDLHLLAFKSTLTFIWT